MQEQCATVDHWLHGRDDASAGVDLPENLLAHVVACPRCRGRLLLLVAARGGPWSPPAEHSCDATEEQLAALVDYERAQGVIAAAQAFPAVWWGTVVCPHCAQAYRELYEIAAPVTLEQAPLPASGTRHLQVRVPAALVRRVTGAAARLGVAWGQPYSDLMLSEEDHEECRVQVYLRRKHAGQLTLVVRTEPPARGIASLMVAHEVFYLQLDPEGSAVFADLSENLFASSSDLFVTLDTLF